MASNVMQDTIDRYTEQEHGDPEQACVYADIDGTVLSNDEWRAAMSVNGNVSSGQNCFNNWAALKNGRVIAGAQPLTRKLHERNIRTTFITNRPLKVNGQDTTNTLERATREELKEKKLMTDRDILLMRDSEHAERSKSARIAKARKTLFDHRKPALELYIGDAVRDLDIEPYDLHEDKKEQWPDEVDELGTRRFLCPSPVFSKGWQTEWDTWRDSQPDSEYGTTSLVSRQLRYWPAITPAMPVTVH